MMVAGNPALRTLTTMMAAKTGATDDDAKECSICITARLRWCHRSGTQLGWSPSGSCFNGDAIFDHRRDDESHDDLDR
jgi:hypothetical protein